MGHAGRACGRYGFPPEGRREGWSVAGTSVSRPGAAGGGPAGRAGLNGLVSGVLGRAIG